MVSIKLKFRPSTIEGKVGSLYYQVIYMRKVRQVSTNFRITRSEWDSELEDLIIKDDDSSRANYLQYVQNHIEYDKKCFKRIVKKLTISDSPFTVDTIVDEFHKQSFEITLFSYMASFPQQDNPPHGYRIFLSASTHLQGRWGSCTHDRDKGSCGHRCISSTSS